MCFPFLWNLCWKIKLWLWACLQQRHNEKDNLTFCQSDFFSGWRMINHWQPIKIHSNLKGSHIKNGKKSTFSAAQRNLVELHIASLNFWVTNDPEFLVRCTFNLSNINSIFSITFCYVLLYIDFHAGRIENFSLHTGGGQKEICARNAWHKHERKLINLTFWRTNNVAIIHYFVPVSLTRPVYVM